MVTNGNTTPRCWVTLLTQASYLPGVITLAFSLSLQKSKYPLVVLVTPSLPGSCLGALKLEAVDNPFLVIRTIAPLLPPSSKKTTLIAQRFEDTWTKLRAFELTSYDACVFLDADITVYKNIDELFEVRLPGRDWIAACHSCVCNLDHDSWAAANWTRENCAYTPLSHPSALQTATPTPQKEGPPHTHALLNGGAFLYHPSPTLWKQILDYFNTCPDLSNFLFPDQDFLAAFFVHRWVPLSWKFNAIKTMRQWHTNIWRDDEVKALHYIVDKPWLRRIASDGIAGHLGRDGMTHSWWWNVYQRWRDTNTESQREKELVRRPGRPIAFELVSILDEIVAPELDSEANAKQCKENQKRGFPVPISMDRDEREDDPHKANVAVKAPTNGTKNGISY